jgi:hypothetical protein
VPSESKVVEGTAQFSAARSLGSMDQGPISLCSFGDINVAMCLLMSRFVSGYESGRKCGAFNGADR